MSKVPHASLPMSSAATMGTGMVLGATALTASSSTTKNTPDIIHGAHVEQRAATTTLTTATDAHDTGQ